LIYIIKYINIYILIYNLLLSDYKMFDFQWKIKNSFSKVRRDVDDLRESSNDWIVFLDDKGSEMEKRLDKIEDRMERIEEAMFRILSLR